jgi:L-fuculose-phosphate aldolase
VSLRLKTGDVLVTASQHSLAHVRPEDLVLLDAGGTPHDASQRPTSELPLHLAAYASRPDISCVMHTHPTMTVVYSKTGGIFPRDTVGASESLGNAAWTPYRKNGTQELADLCAAEFARGIDIVVMERHGLSVIGHSLEEAFVQTDLAEEASRLAYYSALLLR